MADFPRINQRNYGRQLTEWLGQVRDIANGGINEWTTSPSTNQNGQPLSPLDAGYFGYNKSKFQFEVWNGEEWEDKIVSFDGQIVSLTETELDTTVAYTFSISPSGAAVGWGYDSIIESNVPFNIPVGKVETFYTLDLQTSFYVHNHLSSIVSATKFFTSLSAYHGQELVVYKRKPAPPQPSLSYQSILKKENDGSPVAIGEPISITPTIAVNGYIGLNVIVTSDAIAKLNAQMALLGVTSVAIFIDYVDENRRIHGRVSSSEISSTSFVMDIKYPVIPAAFPLSNYSSHFVFPATSGSIYIFKPDEQDVFTWVPGSITNFYRQKTSAPVFPSCYDLAMYANGNENVYPIALTLRSDNGFSSCGFHPYRVAGDTGSGIKFYGRVYSANAYPNQISTQYVPYERMYLSPLGNLGIGNGLDNPSDRLHVDGNVRAVNFVTDANASDATLKENLFSIEGVWPVLKEIKPFSFTWKKGQILQEETEAYLDPESGVFYPARPPITTDSLPDGIMVSYSAQEIEETLAPEAVFRDGYGVCHLRKEDLVPYLHQAMVEMDSFYEQKITGFEKRIKNLEMQLAKLRQSHKVKNQDKQ